MPFDERMLRALEGRNYGIKIEVLDYAGNLKPEELIDWLNSMDFFLNGSLWQRKRRWNSHAPSWRVMPWSGGIMYRKIEQKKEKTKSKPGKRWRKGCEKNSCLWTMHKLFSINFRTWSRTCLPWKNKRTSFTNYPFMWITRKLMRNWMQGMWTV